MELIVLGASGTFPRPGGALSGYLIRHKETAVLLDIGSGVLSNLYAWLYPAKLDGLIVTHLHPDHFLDIYPFRYLLEFTAKERLPFSVFAPEGAREHIQPLFSEANPARFDEVFHFFALKDKAQFRIGSLTFTSLKVPHLEPTFGIRVETEGKAVFYTSDTGYDTKLIAYAQEVDLLLAETTLLKTQAGEPVAHLTTHQVGQIAQEAGAKKLVLTHLWPHFNREQILAEVKEVYKGPTLLAAENLRVGV
jgi:ribonuclease BN (tRNA processing enzyme)